jgi:hypothetical protein
MPRGDEIIRVEQHQIEQLVALGLRRYEAIQAVDAGLGSQAVEALAAGSGGTVAAALERAR